MVRLKLHKRTISRLIGLLIKPVNTGPPTRTASFFYSTDGEKDVETGELDDVVFPSVIHPFPEHLIKNPLINKQSDTWTVPPNTTLKEWCVWRDRVIRPFFISADWKRYPNFALTRRLFVQPFLPDWLPYHLEYPLAFDYRSHDEFLLFTDGNGCFLIVKVKSVDCKPRSKHQAACRRFASMWHKSNPQVKKTTAVVVSEKKISHVTFLQR